MNAIAIPNFRPAGESFGASLASALGSLSGAASSTIKPSHAEDLLPTDLAPVDRGLQQQDVQNYGKKQASQLEDLRQYAEKANTYLRRVDTHLEFNVSEQTGRVVINVVDSDTKQVLRQIPPEAMKHVSDHIARLRGLLFEASG